MTHSFHFEKQLVSFRFRSWGLAQLLQSVERGGNEVSWVQGSTCEGSGPLLCIPSSLLSEARTALVDEPLFYRLPWQEFSKARQTSLLGQLYASRPLNKLQLITKKSNKYL